MATTTIKLFPSSPRVIYDKAPLIEVICQLRFPSLLSIEGKPPVEFQEQIRSHFPLLEKGADQLPTDLPPEIAQIIRGQANPTSYRFLTENSASTVTLSPDALALSTTKYTEWKDFREELRVPLAALKDIYNPSFFSRIGLRYQDAIDRAALGLENVPWSQLLQKHVLGELALPEFEDNLEQASRTLKVRMPDGSGSVQMRHGLANLRGRTDPCYMIDIDFFTEQRTEVADAEHTLDHFNGIAGHAFRWCITDTLREALSPRELAIDSA